MKLKIDRNSIRYKIILYFMFFAVMLLSILWCLQVLFLNTFYESMKESQTKAVTRSIEAAYASNSFNDFSSGVYSIVEKNDIYVYITTLAGEPLLTYGNEPIHSNYDDEIKRINNLMISGENQPVSLLMRNERGGRKIMAYGTLLKSDDKPTLVAYIISPLHPINSTIEILKNQLIYVTAIVLLLSFIGAFYLATHMSTPIKRMNRSATKLAQGEYGIVFDGGPYTELSNLADTLTKASIELEKSMSMQKDLIANVSHDLRTPLTMVKSYAEMIRDLSGDNPEKREEHLQVIIDEADRLNLLVGDLLTLSKMQSDAITINRSSFNFRELVDSVYNSYKLVIEEEGYTVNITCPDRIMVNADPDRIKQVLYNLVHNATKFCGEDKVINIIIKRRGRNALCQIQDNGKGIPKDDLEHIWDRYYKASSNMVRSSSGTGLGLSIVKEILTLHKVHFGVESKEDKGSTFWFELPIA